MKENTLRMSGKEVDVCIKKTAQGDIDALRRLYEEFKTPVYLLALAILKDTGLAEDILQQTFIGIKANASSYRQGTNAKAWILSITRNMSKNCLRERHYEICDPFSEENGPSKALCLSARNEDLLSGIVVSEKLAQLQETERDIVIYHVFAGMKHTQTARLLKLPYGTVLWKYSMALKKLKKLYEQDFSERLLSE